jgi:4-methyl-5(b-hydroxyethyl)-thiazole monophosphate biosynthesis
MTGGEPTVLIPIANGSEDMETAIIADILVRGGAKVELAAVEGDGAPVVLARGLRVVPTTTIAEARARFRHDGHHAFSAIVCPGGMPGARTLGESADLTAILKAATESHSVLVAAICAAPVHVLGKHGLLPKGHAATCFPGMKDHLPAGIDFVDSPVVETARVITSQGPGTAIQFGLALVRRLCGEEKAVAVAKALLVSPTLPFESKI